MTTTRVGCVFRPQFAPETLAAAARAADAAGLDELWLWEDCFLSGGVSSAAIALANSQRLTVGVGVLPVPLRNVALTAMEIATLCRSFPGRVRVGLGHGVQDWMAQIGEKVASPMTLLREHLSALRLLLDGQEVTVEGRYVKLDGVKLDWPPQAGVELLCAAGGPKTLALSGELASGTVITGGTSPDGLAAAMPHVRAGLALRPEPASHSVVAYVQCALGADAKSRALQELQVWGFDVDADLAAYGTPDEVAAAAGRWVQAGADTIVFQPGPDVDVVDFVTDIAVQVQPLMNRTSR
ncbi:oxidoreductase [Mycobacterium sp. MS1601]|uniref:LLM class flavin-dependent oxidoreductase n=1 Tax=Mycobacterium sp. MS1601 TaxID=1936029 RepID=UPI0009792E95|nr:LLM class flavin-dependent oxidoreductase [Mycobacterium sp. MS1601]AQA05538.1 oxidoreductase [Mycobacterium sp. MS1601]